jgi:tetratricopeptide (TPR) repeat protein
MPLLLRGEKSYMPSKPPPEKTTGLTQRAQMLISLGRSADAARLLHDALAQSPDDAKTMCLLSQAYSELDQYSEAERWAEQAIAAAPEQEWGYRLLAWHLLDQGAPHTALPPGVCIFWPEFSGI